MLFQFAITFCVGQKIPVVVLIRIVALIA